MHRTFFLNQQFSHRLARRYKDKQSVVRHFVQISHQLILMHNRRINPCLLDILESLVKETTLRHILFFYKPLYSRFLEKIRHLPLAVSRRGFSRSWGKCRPRYCGSGPWCSDTAVRGRPGMTRSV